MATSRRSTSRATGSISPGIRRSSRSRPSAAATSSSSTCSTPRGGQLTAELDRRGPRPARLRPGRPGQRPDRRRGRRARRHAAGRAARVRARRLGLDREHPRLRPPRGRVPRPVPADHARAAAGGRAEFLPGVRVPIVPFCGEVGVAPPDGPRSTIPPDVFGGNMDTRHLTAGATLFLPVFHAGARLSMGDGHAAQGDGEVCGTAIETPMRALVRLTVRKDLHVTAPEFLTAGRRRRSRPGGATRRTASGRTSSGRPATPSAG